MIIIKDKGKLELLVVLNIHRILRKSSVVFGPIIKRFLSSLELLCDHVMGILCIALEKKGVWHNGTICSGFPSEKA